MMTTVPHVTSGLGLRKFQADGFLLTRVYKDLEIKVSRMWKVRTKNVPIIIGAIGTITKGLDQKL